jgi:hypothetical protein
VDLPLPESSAKSMVDQTTYSDLTEIPMPGWMVDGRLEARDAAGQSGSAPFTFQPAGAGFHRSPGPRPDRTAPESGHRRRRGTASVVLLTLDALTIAPERFYDGKDDIYMGLRAAYWGTR